MSTCAGRRSPRNTLNVRPTNLAPVNSSLSWAFPLIVLLLLACSPSQALPTPIQLAEQHIPANPELANQFAIFVMQSDNLPAQLTGQTVRASIRNEAEWQYYEIGELGRDRHEVTAVASVRIPFDQGHVNAKLPFTLTVDRKEQSVLTAQADYNSTLAGVDVERSSGQGSPTPLRATVPALVPTVTTSPPTQDNDLIAVAAACIWGAAHSDTLPSLPATWLESPVVMAQMRSDGIGTPEDLKAAAESSVSYFDTLDEYIETLRLTVEPSGIMDDMLGSHLIYCGDLWQGEEATDVPDRDDLVSSVAECIWRVAHSDELPTVPESVNMSPEEVRSVAQEMVTDALAAYWLDEEFRADLHTGEATEGLLEALHHIFCGKRWEAF